MWKPTQKLVLLALIKFSRISGTRTRAFRRRRSRERATSHPNRSRRTCYFPVPSDPSVRLHGNSLLQGWHVSKNIFVGGGALADGPSRRHLSLGPAAYVESPLYGLRRLWCWQMSKTEENQRDSRFTMYLCRGLTASFMKVPSRLSGLKAWVASK